MTLSASNTKTNVRATSVCMQMGLHGGNRVPCALMGESGIGKTDAIVAIAKKIQEKSGIPFPSETHSAAQMQGEDIGGLPVPDFETETTRFFPVRLGRQIIAAGQGVLAFDEFGSISPSLEGALLCTLQGGIIGETVLPNAVSMVVMLNPEEYASNGRGLSVPASNRLVWIPWQLDLAPWHDHLLGGPGLSVDIDILPKNWEQDYGHLGTSLVISYTLRNPGVVQNQPLSHETSKAWPSNRSWKTAARLLGATLSLGEKKESDLAHLLLSGTIGDSYAVGFMDWLIKVNLPDPEELLKDVTKALTMLPEREDQLGVTLEALAVAALQEHENKAERWENAWAIVGPTFVAKDDVGVTAAKLLSREIPKGAKRPPEARRVVEVLRRAGLIADSLL